MFMMNPAASPIEAKAAYTLLEIIANPDLAKQHLDALMAESMAATQSRENAHKLVTEAKEKDAVAEAKLAEINKLIEDHGRDHAVRTKQLDDRHNSLAANDARLTAYEATVAAREKKLTSSIAAREKAAANKEAALNEREASLMALEKAAQAMKETYEGRMTALKHAMGG